MLFICMGIFQPTRSNVASFESVFNGIVERGSSRHSKVLLLKLDQLPLVVIVFEIGVSLASPAREIFTEEFLQKPDLNS